MITVQDMVDCYSGQNKELTIVQLFSEYDSNTNQNRRLKYYEWCEEHLGRINDLWAKDGVTMYSWRIMFKNKEDAVIFKLRFDL